MFRRLTGLTLILALLFGVLTTGSTIIGRGSDPIVIAALITPNDLSPQSRPPAEVALLDLSRFLRADQLIPISDIEAVSFNYTHFGRILVTTYNRNRIGKTYTYQAGTYQYDYVNRTLDEVSFYESKLAGLSSNIHYYHSIPTASRDGRKLAFIDPIKLRINIYDTTTAQASLLTDLSFKQGSLPTLSWSPDSNYIGLQSTTSIEIINVQNGTVRPVNFDASSSAYFYPTWSDNGQYIWIQRPTPVGGMAFPENPPIEIIDVATGEELEITQGLRGRVTLWWGCDSQWLGYIVTTEERSDGYLLDMKLGTTTRLNDDPLLADVKIEAISSLPSCTQFVINGEQVEVPLAQARQPMYPLYFFDALSKSVALINESASTKGFDDHQIMYEKAVSNTNQLQLFRRGLNPLTEPVLLSEYIGEQQTWSNGSPDFTFRTYIKPATINTSGGTLRYLNFKNSQIHNLTTENEYVHGYMQQNWRTFQGTE